MKDLAALGLGRPHVAAEKTAIDHLFLSLHGNRFLEEKIKRAVHELDPRYFAIVQIDKSYVR